MEVMVRFSQDFVRVTGSPRLTIALEEGATVADLLAALRDQYPALAKPLAAAIPVLTGQYADEATTLQAGQEVSLLTPVSGGR